MRYRIRPALWAALADDERSMAWLARQIGYTPQHVRRLHVEPDWLVLPRFAEKAAEVLGRDIDDLFERVGGHPERR